MGYRVQYSRAGSKGGVLSHVIADRLEREFTIEDLEEWTEYEVRVQAFNGIGSGPLSLAIVGRTRESGEHALAARSNTLEFLLHLSPFHFLSQQYLRQILYNISLSALLHYGSALMKILLNKSQCTLTHSL